MTFGYSRDDAEGGFLLKYVEDDILPVNPFQTLDDAVVGLMQDRRREGPRGHGPTSSWASAASTAATPSRSPVRAVGLDYVSCSPFRVPVARLAAAQATLGTLADK